MNDHVAEIDQNPRPVRVPFDPRHSVAVRANGFDDGVGYCASLNLRAAGDDRKRIGKNRSTADVQGGKGFTFFVERALAYDVD